jgi:hypothetical protein
MSGGFGYLQARVQARFAELPDSALWNLLEPRRDFPGYLAEARATALRPWLCEIATDSDSGTVERLLQRRLMLLLDEACGWTPAPWRAAVRWLRHLPELPLLDAALRSGNLEDQAFPEEQRELMTQAQRQGSLANAWLQNWRSLWPAPHLSRRIALEQLIDLLGEHLRVFPGLPVRAAWEARTQLEYRLRLGFRRWSGQPAALFAWLALNALLRERLRGALLTRLLFASASTGDER